MRPLAGLVWKVPAALAAGSLVAGYVLATALPLDASLRTILRGVLLAGIAAQAALSALLVARLARPLRRAAAARGDDAASRRAASSGHRLPARVGAFGLLASAATTSAAALALRAAGTPADLTVAAAGIGLACAILSGLVAHSLAAAAAARALEALDAPAGATPRGTVHARLLVLGLGLDTIAVLLLAATGYARQRVEVDREYVAAAARAQESAIAAAGHRGGPELAERVWLATSSPTALLGAGGRVVARFGAADVPFDRAHDRGPGSLQVEGGWLVTTATPAVGAIASWVPEAPLRPRRQALWGQIATVGLVVYAATAVLMWLAARAIALPLRALGRAADRIASGDLTAVPPSVSGDEMGQLALQLRRMAEGLKALVSDVQSSSEGASLGAREAAAIGERVRAGALGQRQGVVAVQAAVSAMEGSVGLVSRGVGGLSDYVAATSQAVTEMATSLEEVQRQGAELQRAMDAAMTDVEHLGGAGRDAEARLSQLEALAGQAGGTLAMVRGSTAGLERAADESETTAALVVEMAERAVGVVDETVQGIETLRAAVADAHRRVTALGRRSDDIDQVVDFISEVAGRTSLLSLNASIIAAQAGEHGKAFSVVADQIRELAAQIARSTKSIGDIIHSVREDVEASASLIDRGDALAVEGVQLARNSLDALGQIRRSTAQARETATAIRDAVDGQVRSSREVSQLVESVANGARVASSAVQLVGRSVAGVHTVSRGVNATVDQIARALEEQSAVGRRQLESLGRLERMIGEITRAVENHGAATRRVHDALQELSGAAGEHGSAVEGLSAVAERLGARARSLTESVGRFKVRG